MTQADRIREFALLHHLQAARAQGRKEVVIRAGDVHRAMGLVNAMAAVCSALGSNKFREFASVIALERTGPANGANVYFRFSFRERDSIQKAATSRILTPPPGPGHRGQGLDLRGAVVLIACVKSKRPHRCAACALYTSSWFTKVRDLVERSGARWFILSARYGLVEPDVAVAPYDYTLNRLGVSERKAWAAKVLDQLLPELVSETRVVMFAGDRYREFLSGPLTHNNIEVIVPMRGLRRGEQLAWLSDQT